MWNITNQRLTNAVLKKIHREWKTSGGRNDYGVGEEVEFLTTQGWKRGVISRTHFQNTFMKQEQYRSYSVMIAPGHIETAISPLMRSRTESS